MTNRKYSRNSYVSFIAALLLLVSGCASTKEDWEVAKKKGTAEAIESFIRKHPDSYYTIIELRKRAWEDAQATNTIAAYEGFLAQSDRKYVSYVLYGRYNDEARKKLENLVAERDWEEANKLGTIDAYSGYISSHPNNKQSDVARLKLQQLREKSAWELARLSGSSTEIQSYIDKYPMSLHLDEATALYERAKYDEAITAGTDEALLEYISESQSVKLTNKAIKQLKSYRHANSMIIPWTKIPSVYAGKTGPYTCGIDMKGFNRRPEEYWTAEDKPYKGRAMMVGSATYYAPDVAI